MFGQSSSKTRKEAKAKALAIQDELDHRAKGMRHGIKKHASDLQDQFNDFRENAGERLSEHSQRAQQLTRESAHHVDRNVREYPWAYVAGGTVLGLAVGYLLGRR